jgi:hypothetical protein
MAAAVAMQNDTSVFRIFMNDFFRMLMLTTVDFHSPDVSRLTRPQWNHYGYDTGKNAANPVVLARRA